MACVSAGGRRARTSRSGQATTLSPMEMPGRYLTFSCVSLMICVRVRPPTCSSYTHMRTSSANSPVLSLDSWQFRATSLAAAQAHAPGQVAHSEYLPLLVIKQPRGLPRISRHERLDKRSVRLERNAERASRLTNMGPVWVQYMHLSQ